MKLFLFLTIVISVAESQKCKKKHNLSDGNLVISEDGNCRHIVKTATAAVINVKCGTFNIPKKGKKCSRKAWLRIKAGKEKSKKYCGDIIPDFTTSKAVKKLIIWTKGNTNNYVCTLSTTTSPASTTTTATTTTTTTAAPGSGAQLNYTGCGIQGQEHGVGEIVGGHDADVGEWPWQVHLGGCGGTILTSSCVLTAAHCISDSKLNGGFNVYAGVHDRRTIATDPNVQLRVAEKAIRHPEYSGGVNDVAIIKLQTPFDFSQNAVNSACLPTEEYSYAGVNGTATGFGLTSKPGGSTSQILQEARYPILANSDSICGNRGDHILCAAHPDKGTCNGDSGGPMVVPGQNGAWSVVGVNSFGVTSNCINPDFFMRVSHYLDFITQHCG